MQEIRRLRPGEEKLVETIRSICFNFTYDGDTAKRDEYSMPEEWNIGYFEGETLCSALEEIPYTIRFDGQDVMMSGIGGVVTLPEHRRGGKVRALFQTMLDGAYERGIAFSALAPFSHSFYRMFGYEVCNDRYNVTIERKAFKQATAKGSFAQHMPGEPTDALAEIYRAYTREINLAVVRDAWAENMAWRMFARSHPAKDGVFRYIWSDDNGKPRAYVSFKREGNVNDKLTLHVRELIFTDAEALKAMLSFFARLQFEKVVWNAPTFLTMGDLFPECWEFTQQRPARDMFRVVHLQNTLAIMRHPVGEGEYILQAEDPMLKQNQSRLLVQYGPEGAHVSTTNKDADLTADIATLSQLITGYRTLDSALFAREGIQLHGNANTLRAVFTKRPTHLTEDF